MHHRSKKSLVFALLAVTAGVLMSSGCALSKLKNTEQLLARSEAFQARPPQPTQRLLIIGDSTGVGTGASTPKTSVAGLIAADHPDWLIDNRAVNGAKFADLAGQMPTAERYDTVLIICGGNDVLRFTDGDALKQSIADVVQRSTAIASRVILLPPGNVGNSPSLYPPWSWWITSRSKTMHAAVREVAAASGAVYVNLYQDHANDPFAQDPDRMNAADGVHPSDAGYALWYRSLRTLAAL